VNPNTLGSSASALLIRGNLAVVKSRHNKWRKNNTPKRLMWQKGDVFAIQNRQSCHISRIQQGEKRPIWHVGKSLERQDWYPLCLFALLVETMLPS
jgi:hypothetical protein